MFLLSSRHIFCFLEARLDDGSNVSRMAKLENTRETARATNASGNMFPRFARA